MYGAIILLFAINFQSLSNILKQYLPQEHYNIIQF